MALAATYEISLLALIWRRLYGKRLPPAPWSLGRWGLPINVCGLIVSKLMGKGPAQITCFPRGVLL